MLREVVRSAGAACVCIGLLAAGTVTSAAQEDGGGGDCQLQGSDMLNQAEDLINQAAKLDTTEATSSAADAQYEQAWKRIQLALQQGDPSAAAYYMAGRASIGTGDYARADSMLARFVKKKPACGKIASDIRFDAWATSFNRGIRAYQARDDSTALARFEQANQIREDPRSLNNAALILQQRGEMDRAEELYRQALKLSEGSEEYADQYRKATINLAEILRNRGQREQMLSLYREYLDQSPDDVTAKINYAVGLREAGQSDSAQAVLRSVVESGDLSFQEGLNVGSTLIGLKSYGDARRVLTRAREQRPYHKAAMEELMTASANSGELGRAAALGDTLTSWYPYQKQLFQAYVQVLDRQGRADRVERILPDMQNMAIRIPQSGMSEVAENQYVVRGQVRGGTVTERTVTLPIELLGADGQVVGSTEAQIQVPGADRLSAFQVTVQTDRPAVGFRYGRIQQGS